MPFVLQKAFKNFHVKTDDEQSENDLYNVTLNTMNMKSISLIITCIFYFLVETVFAQVTTTEKTVDKKSDMITKIIKDNIDDVASTVKQNHLSKEERIHQFISNVNVILNTDISKFKGDTFLVADDGAVSYKSNQELCGFKPLVVSINNADDEVQDYFFLGQFLADRKRPPVDEIIKKLEEFFIYDSKTVKKEMKPKPNEPDAKKIDRIVYFGKQNFDNTEMHHFVKIMIASDTTYWIQIYNNVYKHAPKPYVNKTKFNFDFTTAPAGWDEINNKWYKSEFKKEKWFIEHLKKSPSLKNDWENYFFTGYMENDPVVINEELVGSFKLVSGEDSASYGYSFTIKCKEGKYYNHVTFLLNKSKKTFSVFTTSLLGNQTVNDAIKNYLVRDMPCQANDKDAIDQIGARRNKGEFQFSLNSKMVYKVVDENPGCPMSVPIQIIVRNKAKIEMDDMHFNYKPKAISAFFVQ